MRARVGPDGMLTLGGWQARAVLGAGGIRIRKQEGDGATPAGVLPLRRVLYRADRLPRPRAAVPVSPLAPQDGWCDDPTNSAYNRPVRLPYAARHEALWRTDAVYDVIGVLGWNDAPPVRGPGTAPGSAIFLHLARPDRAPTAGCIALDRADLIALLAAGLTEIEVEA